MKDPITTTQEHAAVYPTADHHLASWHDLLLMLSIALSYLTLDRLVMAATLIYTLLRIFVLLRTLRETPK